MALRLCILGSSGKMGKRIVELAQENSAFHICATPSRDVGNLKEVFASSDVVIDFTSAAITQKHLEAAVLANKPLVLGTTGHNAEEKKAIQRAALVIPILHCPNFSVGISLCLEAVAAFRKAVDAAIKIEEVHHVHKKDAPSGTSLALAEAAGVGKSAIKSVRSGEVVGEHTVIFEMGDEVIELKHAALSRDAFALGALRGAEFLVRQKPGLYTKQI